MKRILIFITVCLLLGNLSTKAQSFASWTKNRLTLSNGIITRKLQLPAPGGSFLTISYGPEKGDFNYFESTNTDFEFIANNKVYSGRGNWTLKNIAKTTDSRSGDGAAVTLLSEDRMIELTVRFLLYPGSPAIRKNLVVKNLSQQQMVLESVDVERFDITAYWAPTFSWICHDYGRRRSIGPYDGNMQDALVIVHNSNWQQGIVIGNESPGVVKHTSVFFDGLTICSGLTHKDARFPFRKYIAAGDSFETPQVFTMVYNDRKDPDEMLNTAVPDFVNKFMGTRLSVLKQKPMFVYNTWWPFQKDINEKKVIELANAAAACGMKEFVIDDGWEENYGDWVVDKNKFPRGLKPIFDHIKSLGMKPGLWVSIGTASPQSSVYKAHPQWFIKDAKGQPISLVIADTGKYTACFGTGWYDYIKNVLMKLIIDNGLEYLKLDFSVVSSPYRYDASESGCYAMNHPGHIDHNESLYTNFEQVWKLFDELHAAKPDLFIDCTFETMGGLQLIDYAMLKHADGNWLSNFSAPDSRVDLQIRNMAWWRSPAFPATALVLGNPQMQDSLWELHLKSLAGALPIMLGDPRNLSHADQQKYRGYADWLQTMDRLYSVMSYRQDLPGFGEPMEGMWDGFQRINTDSKSGGIIGVFRQGSFETTRQVTIAGLQPLQMYQVRAMNGKVISTQTGKKLQQTGFTVELDKLYDGALFEIGKSN